MRPLLKLLTSNFNVRLQTKCRPISLVSSKRTRGEDTLDDGGTKSSGQSKRSLTMAVGLGTFVIGMLSYKTVQAKSIEKNKPEERDTPRKTYTPEEVSHHNSLEKGVWITYKGQVYDITDFVKHHPGGMHTVMMGAGGDVEPFWETYKVHYATEVQQLLASYRIGDLKTESQTAPTDENKQIDSPYSNDPERSKLLNTLTKEPFNAETPPKILIQSKITSDDVFFVRNHLPVPEVDLNDYRLSVCFGTDKDHEGQRVVAEFTLDELKKKFPSHSVESVVQCSGNRRSDLKKIKEIKGLNWSVGAIGNAVWTGVLLVDLLNSIGIKLDEAIKHLQMEGLDSDMSGQSYGASISADVAFDPKREVLLAYEMNGKPLSRDHGFPVRVIIPGVTGARNVKWLSRLILSHEESNSHWQRNDYKSFSPNVDMFNLDYSQAASIQEMPVQSAICNLSDQESVVVDKHQTSIPVTGYAYSGGGKMVVRVDVSSDGGKTWITADMEDVARQADGTPDYTKRNRTYSWTRWSIDVPISDTDRASGSMEILCRAFDSAYNGQPERPETIWNVRGVVNNSWHKVRVNLDCTK